ncbi:hypothetical protein [Enterocloster citroniae]
MAELSEKDKLYNEILETVKEHGAGLEIGLVRAVLAEVECEIAMRVGRQNFDIVSDKLKERTPHECESQPLSPGKSFNIN